MANGQSSEPNVIICSDQHAFDLDAAYRFTALSALATRSDRPFAVALAGGHTPARLYSLLATAPFMNAIDWTRVHLFFGDERCVPSSSEYSNLRMVRETLIDTARIPEANVHAIPVEHGDAETAAAQYALDLAAFFEGAPVPRFDLILLGMGADGHCASLFPHTSALFETSRWVVRNVPGLEPYVPRVTLTLPVLNNAANIIFLVAGAEKAATAERVLTGPLIPEELPSQAVCPRNGALTWLLDRAAAGRLLS